MHPEVSRLNRTRLPARKVAQAELVLNQLRNLEQQVLEMRDAAICALYESGDSLQVIADLTGLTRGRVYQVVRRQREG